MEFDDDTFVTLGQLLKKYTPGTLATAIDNNGIHGWDSYGRFKHFKKPDCKEYSEALSLLAYQFEWMVDVYKDNSLPPCERGEGFDPYSRYGWPKDRSPDFEVLSKEEENQPTPRVRPSAQKKSENSSLAIIGAMLACVQGRINNERKNLYRSEAELINEMQVKYKDKFSGLSTSHLESVFSQAKKFIGVDGYHKNN